jgi:hypothetical protein
MVLQDGSNRVVGKAATLDRVLCKLSILITDKTATESAYPQCAVAVLIKDADVIMPNGASIGFVENFEFNTVKPDKALLCPNPDIAIIGLQHGLNTVLGQAIIRVPDPMNILRDRLMRIETQGSAGKADT